MSEWITKHGAKAKQVYTATDLRALDVDNTDYLMGIFASSSLGYDYNRDNDTIPALSEMTGKALEVLSFKIISILQL